MSVPLVSILIPAYNAEQWIDETIQSALDQTYPNKEIIIVDDGSKDNTFSIAKNYQNRFLKVIQQENSGASYARNHAYELSQGDYIQWLDADDILHRDKIAHQIKRALELKDNKILYSSAWARFYFRTSKAKFKKTSLGEDLSPKEWLTRRMANGDWIGNMGWLVSRDLTEAAGLWDIKLTADDDGEYFARIVSKSNLVAYVPESLSYRRLTASGSLSNSVLFSKRSALSQLDSMLKQIEYLLAIENSERAKSAGLALLQENYAYYYPDMTDAINLLKDKARSLGGDLREPKIRWKFLVFKYLFGWKTANYMQNHLPSLKVIFIKFFDKMLYYL
jgi:glycosyltransferase involved in cell wall biosynthesis